MLTIATGRSSKDAGWRLISRRGIRIGRRMLVEASLRQTTYVSVDVLKYHMALNGTSRMSCICAD